MHSYGSWAGCSTIDKAVFIQRGQSGAGVNWSRRAGPVSSVAVPCGVGTERRPVRRCRRRSYAADDVTRVSASDVTSVSANDVTRLSANDVTRLSANDVTRLSALPSVSWRLIVERRDA